MPRGGGAILQEGQRQSWGLESQHAGQAPAALGAGDLGSLPVLSLGVSVTGQLFLCLRGIVRPQ